MAEYRLFETWTPQASYSNAAEYYGLGLEFYVTAPATLTRIWYYRANTSTDDTPPAEVYSVSTGTSGTAVAGTAVSFPSSTATGWRSVALPSPVELTPNQSYRVNVYLGNTPFAYTTDPFASTGAWSAGISDGPLVAPSNADSVGQMQSPHTFKASADVVRYPDRDGTGDWYGIDVTIEDAEHGSADLVADTTLAADGAQIQQGTASLSADTTLVATGKISAEQGAADLAAHTTLAATGHTPGAGTADLAVTTTLAATGLATPQGAAELDIDSRIAATGPRPYEGTLQRVEFLALNADGTVRAPLPDVKTWTLSPLLADAGSITLDYPADGINFSILHDNVTQDRDLNVAVAINGRIQPRLQAVLTESAGDDVAPGSVWTFSGNFTEQWLSEAVVTPKAGMPSQGDDPASDNDAHFYSATAGTILRTLLQEANDRGALTHVDWSSFSNDTDTNGRRFTRIITLKFAPGLTLLDVAKALVSYGMCEFEMDGSQLRVYEGRTASTDRTATDPPVIFRAGQQVADSPRKHSLRDTATALLVAGGDGIYHAESDPTALAKRGRRIETYTSQGNIHDAGVLAGYAQTALAGLVNGTMEKTHGLALSDGPQPLRDYALGDWAWSDVGSGLERLRIKQLTVTGDDTGSITGTVSLNDLIAEREAAMARRIQGIEGGATVTGTSQTRVRPEDIADTVAPADPANVAVTSLAYTEGGATLAAATAQWTGVAFNADGTAIDDLDYYVVKWRYTDPALRPDVGPGWATIITDEAEAQWSGLVAGARIEVTVAARDTAGNYSGWSTAVYHTLAADDVAPPTPSTPITATLFGSIRVEWDGLGSAGEAMPDDFSQVEVHASAVSGFTPDATTLYTTMSGAGVTSHSSAAYGVTVFFRFVAVDRSGNRSAASAQASGTTRQVVSDDVFDGAIGSQKLADLAVVTAKIADLAVNNAKIGDLAVGKLTAGTLAADVVLGANIATALSGPRVGMDATGFFAYDTTRQTVSIGNDGRATILGEIRTAVTGERFILNPGSASPNVMHSYPASGARYGGIQTSTWNNPMFADVQSDVLSAFSGEYNSSSTTTVDRRTWLELWPGYARLGTYDYPLGRYLTRFDTSGDGLWLRTGREVYIYRDFATYAGEIFVPDNNTGAIHYGKSGASLECFNGELAARNGPPNNNFVNMRAAAFLTGSSQLTKSNIQPLPATYLDVLDTAPATMWQLNYEIEQQGQANARFHIGPMAEDLPPELISNRTGAPEDAMIDMGSEVGLMWEVLRTAREQIRALRVDVNELKGGGSRQP